MGLVVFSLGEVQFYLYGLIIAGAVLLGFLAAWVMARIFDEPLLPVVDICLWGLPAGLLFSRLGYVLGHWHFYLSSPLEALYVWHGGLALYGAAFGFLLAAWYYCRQHGLDVWHWLDILTPGVVLALAVNQLGSFVMQTTVGLPMQSAGLPDYTLAEYVEYRYRPYGFESYEYFRPISLYQAGIQAMVFCILSVAAYFQARARKIIPSGGIFLWGTIMILLARFACGFFYLSAEKNVLLHGGQWLALLAIAACVWIYGRRRNRRKSYLR